MKQIWLLQTPYNHAQNNLCLKKFIQEFLYTCNFLRSLFLIYKPTDHIMIANQLDIYNQTGRKRRRERSRRSTCYCYKEIDVYLQNFFRVLAGKIHTKKKKTWIIGFCFSWYVLNNFLCDFKFLNCKIF